MREEYQKGERYTRYTSLDMRKNRKIVCILISLILIFSATLPAPVAAKSSKTKITISKSKLEPSQKSKIKITKAKKHWRVLFKSSNARVVSLPKKRTLKKSYLVLNMKGKECGNTKITITVQRKVKKKWKNVTKKSFRVYVEKEQEVNEEAFDNLPIAIAGEKTTELSQYVDSNGDIAVIPKDFIVDSVENTVNKGLVVIGPDDSEYVWVPTTTTKLAVRDFKKYFSGGSISDYNDETDLQEYKDMIESVAKYGGYYIGRYEASYLPDSTTPYSKKVTQTSTEKIYTNFSPQRATESCKALYEDNDTVQGFFPWGITWDTTLQWLIDSGAKTKAEVTEDSSSWGNYSNDTFSIDANGRCTGIWEEAKANNIYDLAGNNWEWTQERCGTNYVMRSGGYNLMGGECRGSDYPPTIRDPLPGNNNHPNVAFRTALHIK